MKLRALLPKPADFVLLVGGAMLFHGLRKVYEPAAWIVIGGLMVIVALWPYLKR